jgi:hypothetical protein
VPVEADLAALESERAGQQRQRARLLDLLRQARQREHGAPRRGPVMETAQGTSPTFSSSTSMSVVRPSDASRSASSTAVPTVGCPANGNSRRA